MRFYCFYWGVIKMADGFGMGNRELEVLTDNLSEILRRARYSQKYRPVRSNHLNTDYGKNLYAWLRGMFLWTPFGISYVHENETGVSVPVKLKDDTIKETKLYATAGVYTLEHDPQLSITTMDMAIVAEFEDLIKVYSRVATSGGRGEIDIEWYEEIRSSDVEKMEFEKRRGRIDRNWYDVGMRIQQRIGNLELRNSGRPVFYEYVVSDDFGTGRLVEELRKTGFPCYIGGSDPGILCPIKPELQVDK